MKLFLRILLGLAALLVVLVIGAAAVVATIDKRTLIAPLEAQLEKATGRDVTIGAEPRIEVSLAPTLVLEDVTLANAPWGSAKEMLRAKRLEIQVALLPLLSRRLDLQRFTIVEPTILLETDRNGVANWTFGEAKTAAPPATGAAQAAGAFALGEVTIERGSVTYRDGRTGEVTPIRIERFYVRGRDPAQPLVGAFKGSVAEVPVDVEGAFGPLAALQAGRWPWPISLKGEVAGRKANVEAKLQPVDDAIEAREATIAVGASKLVGSIAWRSRPGAKAHLRFDLKAETLQAADFALAAAAAAAARPAAGPKAADNRVFPATPISFAGLRNVDAQGSLAVTKLVLADGRAFGPLAAKLAVDNAQLTLDEFTLAAHGGQWRGRSVVNAREPQADIALRLDGRQLDLAALLAAAGVQRAIQGGKTDVAADLRMHGNSPRAWAASVNGTLTVKVGAGSLPASNEGLSAELRQLLDALNPLRTSSGRTDLACAVVRLPFNRGVARVERSIAFETSQLGASASGTIDLANETLDLAFAPRMRSGVPIDLARLAGAVRVRGPLADPGVTIDPVGAAAAAADVGALLRGGAAGLVRELGKAQVPTGGDECAVALGAAPARRPPPAAAPDKAGAQQPAQEVEKALRKLFGR